MIPARTIRVFRFAGADVVVSLSSLATYLVIGIWFASPGRATSPVLPVLMVVIVMLSVLVHELAHALAARAFGFAVLLIQLTAFGGSTHFRVSRRASVPMILIAYAGPATNAVVAGGAWIALTSVVDAAVATGTYAHNATTIYLLTSAAYFNLMLAALNAFPGRPFDGGAAVEYLAARFVPPARAQRLAAYPTLIGGVVLGAYYLFAAGSGRWVELLWMGVAAIIFVGAAVSELKRPVGNLS